MITQFILNVAILVAISVISAQFLEFFSKKRLLNDLLQGLLFGLTAVFAMMNPVQFEAGIIFDSRSVILSLCGWFFGPLSAAISTLLAVLYRWSLGGSGATTGILTAMLSACFGLTLYFLYPLRKRLPRAPDLLLFGIMVHVLILILLWLTIPRQYMTRIAPVFLIIYPLATLLSGKVLVKQFQLRETLQTLNLQNQQIQLITDAMRDVLWILEFPSMTFSYVSPSNIHHNGYTPEEAMRMSLEETLSHDSMTDVRRWLKDDLESLSNAKPSESAQAGKTRLIRERCKDGSLIWSEISVSLVKDSGGKPSKIIGVSRNVTRRVEQEIALQESEQKYRALSEELQQSLSEKTALLKEVHHRVKNNLQIITSLLRLEVARVADPLAREVILDMQRRVRSMSLLHETVYQSESLAHVNVESYFNKLSLQILNTMSNQHARIQPHLEIEPVDLDIERAIPCGLLLNELLSNACKHAFDNQTDGQISVRLVRKAPSSLVLEVQDNGKGLPPDFAQRRRQSLGLQLVDDLTRQLNGTLDIQSQSGRGAVFRITFPSKDSL